MTCWVQCAALALVLTGLAAGQSVRSEVLVAEHVWIGQRVRLDVLILVPDQFSGVPSFDLPDVEDALLLRVGGGDSRPTFGSEVVDGVSCTSARYQFAAFFQRSGSFTIPPFEVRFASAEGFGKAQVWHTGSTLEHQVVVESPPGTERLAVVVSTSKLEVDDRWDRSVDGARVGDAFTRTVSLRAPDVPGLLLPVLPLDRVEGLDVYPSDPSVDTATDRGAFVGTRLERITYICSKEGTATIPPLKLRWWNVETETLESIELKGVSFEIGPGVAPPVADVPIALAPGRSLPPWLFSGLGLIAAVVALIATQRARIKTWLEAKRNRWQASERGRFAALRRELSHGDAPSTLTTLYRWLDTHVESGSAATLDRLRAEVGDPALDRELDALERATAGGNVAWSGRALLALLRKARTAHRDAAGPQRGNDLPPLNPPPRPGQ